MRQLRVALMLLALAAFTRPERALAQPSEESVERAITPLGGGLYAAREGERRTVFLATGHGIVLVDPLNVAFARWLSGQFSSRFPGETVQYVIFTRADFDRVGGASVFSATAQIVAQADLADSLRQRRTTLPRSLAPLDVNGSGVLERSEIPAALQPALMPLDGTRDGELTAADVWSGVPGPQAVFATRRVIEIGGSRVELLRPSRLFGGDDTVVYFPEARKLFSAQTPSPTAPLADASVRPRDLVQWLHAIGAKDFDLLVAGDGSTLDRQAIDRLDAYVADLMTQAGDARRRGLPLASVQRASAASSPVGSIPPGQRALDLVRVYTSMRMRQLDGYGAALVSRVSTSGGECWAARCDVPGSRGGALGGAAVSIDRWRAGFELGLRQTTRGRYERGPTVLNQSRRDTLLSGFAGLAPLQIGRFGVAPLAGVTFRRSSTTLVNPDPRVTGVFHESSMRGAFLVGGDVSVSVTPGVALIAPLRYTGMSVQKPATPRFETARDMSIGVGLTVRLVTWIR